MNAAGGYVHVGTYSLGAARTLLPRILMAMDDHARPTHTAGRSSRSTASCSSRSAASRARTRRSTPAARASTRFAAALERLREPPACSSSTSRRCATTSTRRPAPSGCRSGPNTDAAFMLALAHTLIAEGLHDRASSTRYCVGFERFSATCTGDARRPAEDAPSGPRRSATCPPRRIRALARRMAAHAHDDQRRVVAAARATTASSRTGWSSRSPRCSARSARRAAVSASATALRQRRRRERATRSRGRRCRRATNAVKTLIPVARITDMLLNPGARLRLQRQALHAIPTSASSTGPAATRSTITRTSTGCVARVAPARDDRRERAVLDRAARSIADIVLPATTMLERDDIGPPRATAS